MHEHSATCVWKRYPNGKQQCVTAKNERERAKRAAGTLKRTGSPDRWRRQPPDGWEDEFGPVPLKERDRDWYDRVVVHRVLNQEAPGRRPFYREWAEIIGKMQARGLSAMEVARVVGVSEWYVNLMRRRHLG